MVERPLSREELSAKYSDEPWRKRFLRLLEIVAFLRDSIIAADYRIPDEMNDALALSPTGRQVFQHLTTKDHVPVKEARLLCFLVFAHHDLLIDVEGINSEQLIESISSQIKSGVIKHPFTLGRQLYDRAADLFQDERSYLGAVDTARLLNETPAGVWQAGNLLSGPYGLLVTKAARALPPDTRIPLQHCADPTCGVVHAVSLSTDNDAPINEHRPKINRFLQKGKKEASDWSGFISEVLGRSTLSLDDLNPGAIPFFLGDALSDDELKALLTDLLDEGTQGELRSEVARLGLSGPSSQIVQDLGRAQLMQLIMLSSDAVISQRVDHLVRNGSIHVPEGETRTSVLNDMHWGAWHLSVEMGPLGTRISSQDYAVPFLRLRRLVEDLYNIDTIEDIQDLDWRLRTVDGVTVQGRLEEYVRSAVPGSVLSNLALASRLRRDRALEVLRISDKNGQLNDATIVSTALWKLGFPGSLAEGPHDGFWGHHDALTQLARSAGQSSFYDEDPIRAAAGVYFPALEGLLMDTLCYCTWALTNDHFSSGRPFTFQPSVDNQSALDTLNEYLEARQRADLQADASLLVPKASTLHPILRGFGDLARLLEIAREDEAQKVRTKAETPDFVDDTTLQRFPFVHTMPFLDLLPEAQTGLIRQLREMSAALQGAEVDRVRNDLLHFRRSRADIPKLVSALEAVRSVVIAAEQGGIVPKLYRRERRISDEWGRASIVFKAALGQAVTLVRPNNFAWIGLPNLSSDQYIFHAAAFAEPNETLRFTLAQESPYQEMWQNFPRRPKARGVGIATSSEIDLVSEVGTSSASRSA